jgi:hypothetical protein
LSATDIALFATIAVLIASNAAVIVYLGGRIDRLSERQAATDVMVARLDERMQAGFARIETRLTEHAAAHARIAHGQA